LHLSSAPLDIADVPAQAAQTLDHDIFELLRHKGSFRSQATEV